MAKKRDKKRRKEREKAGRQRRGHQLPDDTDSLLKHMLDPRRLRTPRKIDDHVKGFCATINPNEVPVMLEMQPEDWARQGCCDLNVKHYIQKHGGTMVCGYRIWYHKDLYIEAERHAVWRSDDGRYRDVSFSPDGEKESVFIPDVPDKQAHLEQNQDKIRKAVAPSVKHAVDQLERSRRRIKRETMDDETAWKTMPSYKDLKSGVRKPTEWIKKAGE